MIEMIIEFITKKVNYLFYNIIINKIILFRLVQDFEFFKICKKHMEPYVF